MAVGDKPSWGASPPVHAETGGPDWDIKTKVWYHGLVEVPVVPFAGRERVE
jgi:hypothetical protein